MVLRKLGASLCAATCAAISAQALAQGQTQDDLTQLLGTPDSSNQSQAAPAAPAADSSAPAPATPAAAGIPPAAPAGGTATAAPATAPPSAAPEAAAAPAGGARTAAAPARTKNRLVEEIVVTAQKREENIQSVPISISAFSANTLDAKGIDDPKGLAQATPGVYYGQTVNFAIIYIRGVGSDAFLPDSDPSVASYIDGIYFPFANGLSQQFGAVERVEVLKGPQGTLFGRNSTGGAFNTITKTPGHEFETSLLASYGSFDDFKLRGYVSIPISQSVAMSLSVTHNQSNPYYSGTINDVATPFLGIGSGSTARGLPAENSDGARVKMRWNILDNLDLNLAGFVYYQTGLSSSAMPNRHPSLIQSSLQTVFGVQNVTADYQVHVDVPGYFSDINKVGYGQLNWHPAWFDVKLLGSQQKISTDNDFDFDGTQVPFINFNAPGQFADVTTGELQLISRKDGITPDWLEAIAGLFYIREKSGFPGNKLSVLGGISNGEFLGVPLPAGTAAQLTSIIDNPALSGLNGFFNTLGVNLSLPNGADVSLHDGLGTLSYAAFTQETVHFLPWLDVTVGGRFQKETRKVLESSVFLINTDGSQSQVNVPGVTPDTRPSVSTHNFSPKFVVDLKPMDDVLLYASFTRGYKSGTFNTVDIYTQPGYVQPETVSSSELGLKSTWMDGALRFNAAIFQNKIHNLQVQFISLLAGGAVNLQNAGAARINGGEFDAQLNPLPEADPGLVISGGLTYLDGKYTDYQLGTGYDETTGIFFGPLPGGIDTGRNFTGNDITRTPRLSGTFGVNQIFDLGSGDLEVAGSVYYNSGFFYLAQNSPVSQQKSYEVADASVSYLYHPWNTRVTLFCKNLNRAVYTYSKFILDTGELDYDAPPRTVGVRVNWDF